MMKYLLFVFFIVTGAFAASPRPLPTNPVDPLLETIEILSAQDLSCQSAHDCRSLAIGSRACGGPSTYVVVSTLNSTFSIMRNLADLSVKLESDYNREHGVVSVCVLAPLPLFGCSRENQCQEVENL